MTAPNNTTTPAAVSDWYEWQPGDFRLVLHSNNLPEWGDELLGIFVKRAGVYHLTGGEPRPYYAADLEPMLGRACLIPEDPENLTEEQARELPDLAGAQYLAAERARAVLASMVAGLDAWLAERRPAPQE